MLSRTSTWKWKSVAVGLALFPMMSTLEARLAAAPAPISALAEPENTKDAEAKALCGKAREAMKAGDYARAEAIAKQAQSMKNDWEFWDKDRPEALLNDLAVTRAKNSTADPKALLKQAREALTANKFEEAQALAARAGTSNTNWGMFGDSPNKCIDDINKARAKSDRSESMKLMVEARNMYNKGRYDDAESLAYRAERLHTYSVMEMGDKPQKLLGEIQTAKAKQKKSGVVAPEAAVARVSDMKAAPAPSWDDAKPAVAKSDSPPVIQQTSATNNERSARPAPTQTPAVNNSASVAGKKLLDNAAVEMKRGQFEIARQLATEAHNGPYNVKADAIACMKAIDAEENNQRTNSALKSYDAAVSAFNNQDFVQAMAIFRQIDANNLPTEHQVKMTELLTACVKRTHALASIPANEVATPPASVVPAAMQTQDAAPLTPPPSMPTEPVMQPSMVPVPTQQQPAQSTSNLADQVKALQKVEFQRMREESLKVSAESKKLFERGETDSSLEMLESFIAKVKSSQLDANEVNLICRPVEQRLASLKVVKSQKDSETKINGRKTKHDLERGQTALADSRKQDQIKELLKQYDQYIKEGKFQEAHMVAAKAKALNPDDPALAAAEKIALVGANSFGSESAKLNKENMFVKALNQAENPGPYVDSDKPLHVDGPSLEIAKNRGRGIDTIRKMRTDAEKEIQHRLTTTLDMSFNSTPLHQVVSDLKMLSGVNIVLETQALEEERIALDTPVSISLDRIKFESGLKLLLGNLKLTYVIADDVLKITTEKKARGRVEQRVYRVADLVMPIEDYQQPSSMNLEKAMQRVIDAQKMNLGNGQTPFNNGRFMLPNGQAASDPASMSTANGGSMSTSPQQGSSQIGAPTTQKQTMHEMLIKLIQNTISPNSWADVGGAGTVDYMPIGMALVINQTPDVQEQVADLLEALRRLQDLQVAIEIKLITLSETFFERIGLDFNLNLKTDHNTSRFEPQITTGQFKPAGQVNDFSPNRFIAGVNPAGGQFPSTGSFTSDLDIPIRSSSFQYAIPPFAYPNNPGFDGGLSMGLAFLSDIQVYMFMEAAQGDRRIHVMQAPKLTLFNGQSASISVQDQQFFVTNVGIVGFGGQVVFVPQNNPFPLGVEMTLQAVVSADRRFVRVNTNIRMANLASALVPLFPVTTFITPVFEGGAQGQPIPFTQFIQQPALSLVNIQTTVSIPDGGTVILGGLKTLSEGRNEFGPPVLSKVPYVNRLFKNVGFGREAQSLLVMVTPRIIINAEEEERQVGVTSREQ